MKVKRQVWSSLKTPGKCLKGVKSNITVPNFPLPKLSLEEETRLENTIKVRIIFFSNEMTNKEIYGVLNKYLYLVSSKMYTQVLRKEVSFPQCGQKGKVQTNTISYLDLGPNFVPISKIPKNLNHKEKEIILIITLKKFLPLRKENWRLVCRRKELTHEEQSKFIFTNSYILNSVSYFTCYAINKDLRFSITHFVP